MDFPVPPVIDEHLSGEDLRIALQQGKVSEQTLVGYLQRWRYLDGDRAFRIAVEIDPSWIRLFPLVANPGQDWSDELPSKAVAEYQEKTLQRSTETEAWESWLAKWFEKQCGSDHPSWTRPLVEFAATLLKDEAIRSLVTGLGRRETARLIESLHNDRLCMRILQLAPEAISRGLRYAWDLYEKQSPNQRWATLHSLSVGPLGAASLGDPLLLGFSLGVRATERGVGIKDGEFWKSSEFWPLAVGAVSQLPDETLLQANLWALLRRLADLSAHSRNTQNLGVNAEIFAFGRDHPDSWALALPLIIDRCDLLHGTAESVTILLATTAASVSEAIDGLCTGSEPTARRERALGIRTIQRGISSPAHELVRLVMDTVSAWVDRTHIFPHPLSLPASTWLGSLDVESAIRSAVNTSEIEFRGRFQSSAGLDEDIHTANLLAELERSLTNETFALDGLAKQRSRGPAASMTYRQSSKRIEEPKYGLDLALTIKATVQDRLTYEAAQLVQVKKSRRSADGRALSGTWLVDLEQLETILGRSSSACYWFFDERGTVLAIPAKLLLGVSYSRPHRGASFSVSRFEIRGMAISLSQFFVDLFIGGWSGDASEDVLRIARGEDALIHPRIMASVGIEWHRSEPQ